MIGFTTQGLVCWGLYLPETIIDRVTGEARWGWYFCILLLDDRIATYGWPTRILSGGEILLGIDEDAQIFLKLLMLSNLTPWRCKLAPTSWWSSEMGLSEDREFCWSVIAFQIKIHIFMIFYEYIVYSIQYTIVHPSSDAATDLFLLSEPSELRRNLRFEGAF